MYEKWLFSIYYNHNATVQERTTLRCIPTRGLTAKLAPFHYSICSTYWTRSIFLQCAANTSLSFKTIIQYD